MLIGTTQDKEKSLLQRLGERYSSYERLKRAAVYLRKFIDYTTKRNFCKDCTVEDIKETTTALIVDHQKRYFRSEFSALDAAGIKSSSRLRNRGPYIDENGALSVDYEVCYNGFCQSGTLNFNNGINVVPEPPFKQEEILEVWAKNKSAESLVRNLLGCGKRHPVNDL